MAGTVESSIVLNAVDNTKSALNSVQSNLEKLVHKAVEVSNGFSKIWTEWMSWFQLQTTKALNEVNRLTQYLSECTEWTQEYTIVQNRLNSAREKYNQLFEESDERTRQDIQAQIDEYNALQQVNQAQEQHISVLQKAGQFISDNVQKLFSHKETVMSNWQAMQYWEEQIKRVENELSVASRELAWMEWNVHTSSDELQKQREYVRELEQQLKEYKKQLKDTTANMSPFQLALQKLGKNIKSLFLLQTAKNIISWIKNLFKDAINEFIEWWLKLEWVVDYFDNLAERWWMDAIQLRNSLREASRWMITDVELMTSANKAMMLWVGWSVQQMSDLMKIAVVRWQEMGQTATKSFDDMVLWIWRLSPKILDNLWIIIKLNDAYESYANKVWKSVDELTKAEQQQAVMEEVIKKSTAELEMWWNWHLTVADKMQVMKVKWQNALDTIGWAFFRWLEPVIDWINEILDEWTQMADDLSAKMDSASTNIWVAVSWLLQNIYEQLKTSIWMAWDLINDIYTTIVWAIVQVENQLADLFWFTIDWSNDAAPKMWDTFLFALNAIWEWVTAVIKVFKDLWSWAKFWVSAATTGVKNARNQWKNLLQALNPRSDTTMKEALVKNWISMIKDWAKIMNQAKDTYKGVVDGWVDIQAQWITQENRLAEKIVESERYKASALWDISSVFWDKTDLWGWGWSWGSKSKKKDDLEDLKKEMQEYAKETERLKKEKDKWLKSLDDFARDKLKDQAKLIDDLWDEYEKKFKEIQKNIENTEKAIEKLNDQIADLKQKMNDLKTDENKSLANEIVKARKELKWLEEQYEWLKEVAESVSMWDLEWKWGVGKFDVDLIKKYKSYQEELDWVYTWMSASEQEALNKEIEYATRYDSLNWIEKIKEDYRIRQEEIQNELNEKLNALSVEQATLRQYKREQQKLQDEWIKRITEETAKYNEMYEKIKVFEAKYMERIEADHWKQIRMTEQLIDQWNAVYRAKMRALSAWSWDWERAIWGSVSKWKTYLVWEMWPELFVPSTNGRIVNNSDLNKWDWWIEITVNMWGVNVWSDIEVDEMAQRVSDIILRDIQLYKKWIR